MRRSAGDDDSVDGGSIPGTETVPVVSEEAVFILVRAAAFAVRSASALSAELGERYTPPKEIEVSTVVLPSSLGPARW